MAAAHLRRFLALSAFLSFSSPLAAQAPLDAAGDPLPKHAVARLGTLRWRQSFSIQTLSFSYDGKFLASKSDNEGLVYWDAHTGQRVAVGEIPKASLPPDLQRPAGMLRSRDGSVLIDIQADARLGNRRRLTFWEPSPLTKRRETLISVPDIWGVAPYVALTPDGKSLFTGDEERVRVWDVAQAKEVKRLDFAGRSVAVSADGKILAAAGKKALVIWDLAANRERRSIALPEEIHQWLLNLFLSADGRVIAAAGRSFVWAWDSTTGKELLRSLGGSDRSIALSPDGTILYEGTWYYPTIRRWDLTKNLELEPCPGHQGGVWSVSFTPDGKGLLSGSLDRSVRLWQIDKPDVQPRQFPIAASSIVLGGHTALTRDGKYFAMAPDLETVAVLETASGKVVRQFSGLASCVSLAFSPDGKRLAAGDCYYGLSSNPLGRVHVWDVETGKRLHLLENLGNNVRSVAFSQRGDLLATGAANVQVWDAASGKQIQFLPTKRYFNDALAFTPDGRFLVGGGHNLYVWELTSGKPGPQFPGEEIRGVALSPDGKIIAAGNDAGEIRLFDFTSARQLAQLDGHRRRVLCLAFSPDGRRLASGSDDTSIVIWDVAAAIAKQ